VTTEKVILEKISHVSYQAFGGLRQPGKPTRILPAELIIMNSHSPQHYLALCTKNLVYYSLETGRVFEFYCCKCQAAGTPTELKSVQVR
jgi:hypothetical protein